MADTRRFSRANVADWLGLNRATLAVLAVIACLGIAEEVWRNFLGLHLEELAEKSHPDNPILTAVLYMGLYSSAVNLLEGFGYIIGGSVAHHMGSRIALTVSAIPMALGIVVMLVTHSMWAAIAGALLLGNWEPLSVPATFHVVGATVPKNRRTIAFAVQSIQKRLPKVIGPLFGGLAIAAVGFWVNLTMAAVLIALSVILQSILMSAWVHNKEPTHVPLRKIMREMPRDLKRLLTAEIFIRWGDWFARDFASLYVLSLLLNLWGGGAAERAKIDWTFGALLAVMNLTALATYVPVAKWVDRSPSPRPFIGLTFFLFALFPILLVVLPKLSVRAGLPVVAGLVVVFIINGLREIGEPARKALISGGFPPEIRARAVGLYWGLRSFAFFPAPIVAALLWRTIGADATFLIGGGIGLVGTAWFAITNRTTNN